MPEGDDLAAIEALFSAIQKKIEQGELAPNDPPQTGIHGCPAIVVDLEPSRLLEWKSEKGLILTVSRDKNGEVETRRCPPSLITPDDPSVLTTVNWLFCSINKS